jgi:hypothetical protein
VTGNVGAIAMGGMKITRGGQSSSSSSPTSSPGESPSARRIGALMANPHSNLLLTVRLLSINGESTKGGLSDECKLALLQLVVVILLLL